MKKSLLITHKVFICKCKTEWKEENTPNYSVKLRKDGWIIGTKGIIMSGIKYCGKCGEKVI